MKQEGEDTERQEDRGELTESTRGASEKRLKMTGKKRGQETE